MTELSDMLLTFSSGINRPEKGQEGYGASVDATGVNFQYLRWSGTTAQRPSNPPPGWTYYDTTANAEYVWTGSAWTLINGNTGVDLSGVTNGQLLRKNAGAVSGIDASAVTGVASAKGLMWNATTQNLANTAPTTGQVVYYNGSQIAGLSQSLIAGVASAKGLLWNNTTQTLSNTAPTTGQRLQYDGTNIVGVTNPPAAVAAVASSNSTTAITFGSDRLVTWTGTGATALTFLATGAVDGCTVRIYIPANQITSLTLDATLAPAAAFVTAGFDPTAAFLLVMQYHAVGTNRVTSQLFRV